MTLFFLRNKQGDEDKIMFQRIGPGGLHQKYSYYNTLSPLPILAHRLGVPIAEYIVDNHAVTEARSPDCTRQATG